MTIRELANLQHQSVQRSYSSGAVSSVSNQQPQIAPTGKTNSTTQVNQVSRTNSDSLQFLNQYKAKMDSLASAADKIRSLSSDGVWSNLKISTSDEGIVSNATEYGKIPQRAEYNIDVQQLAQKQISSIKVPDTGFQDGTFQITASGMGAPADVSINIDTKNGAATDKEIMEDIVNQVNQQSDLGVKASIVEKDGSSFIQLESTDTGKNMEFSVTGIQSDTLQDAQNLVYTVNGDKQESHSNKYVQIDPSGDNSKLRLNFDGVGKATIKADVDTEKLQKYTEKFVETYNQTIDFLVDNAHRGTGVAETLNRFQQSPISKDAMSSIGLHYGRDGKITFEADEFEKAMQKDTRMVYDILADNYSVADSIYQKADHASGKSAASLLNNSNLQNSNHVTIVINNYYNFNNLSHLNPFSYNPFAYTGPLFFNARV